MQAQESIHKDGSIMGHRYSGLGLPPYKFVGVTQNLFKMPDGTVKPGGTCDYCATSITNEFRVLSADGKRFVLGCDCIDKLGDKNLVVVVESAVRKMKKLQARERAAKKEAIVKAEIESIRPAYDQALVKLAALPHPNSYFATQKGYTMADYYEYQFNGRFPNGQLKVMKQTISKAEAL